MTRRILLIPFLACFKSKKKFDKNNPSHRLRDEKIQEKLEKYIDYFLYWLVQGAIKWYQHGLDNIPEVVRTETELYISENDMVGQIISDYCEVDKGNKNYFVPTSEFYKLLQDKCRYKGLIGTLTQEMHERGFERGNKRINGKLCKVYYGIKLLSSNITDELDVL